MNRTTTIALLLFTGVVIGIFFTWPKYQDFSQLSFEVEARLQELENKEVYFQDLLRVEEDLLKLALPLAKVEAALPLNPQLPRLYDFLQATASFSGMTVRNIAASSIGEQKEGLLMRTIPVTFELSGSFDAIKELIARLHSASRMVSLQSVGIFPGQERERFNVIIQLHTYSY